MNDNTNLKNIFHFRRAFSLKSEADLLNKISLYLSAHLSMSEALLILEEQSESKIKKETFAEWRREIESGKTLAQAFAGTEKLKTLKVTEATRYSAELGGKSGSLAASLKDASLQIQKTLAIKKKITGAVSYPIAILIGTIGLVLGLMLFVFPKIIPLFQTLKVQLPLSTRILIGFSTALTQYWLGSILLLICMITSSALLIKFSIRAREIFQWILLRIPFVGQVIRTKIICGVFDSLNTLLRGGEHLSEAMVGLSKTMKYTEYEVALKEGALRVGEGKPLADFFREKKKLFPLYIFGIISVGEKTGNMESSMKDIADIGREDLDDKLKILTAALEPALMVSMSFIIGFIALSIILPIYGITSHFQNV